MANPIGTKSQRAADERFTRKQQLERINQAWLDQGKELTCFTCPNCYRLTETRKPAPDDVADKGYWDTLTTCLHCDEIFMLIVYPSGATRSMLNSETD